MSLLIARERALRASVCHVLRQLHRTVIDLGRKGRCGFRKSRNSVGVAKFGRPMLLGTITFVAVAEAVKSSQKAVRAPSDKWLGTWGNSRPNPENSDRTVPSHGFLGRFPVRQKTSAGQIWDGQRGRDELFPNGWFDKAPHARRVDGTKRRVLPIECQSTRCGLSPRSAPRWRPKAHPREHRSAQRNPPRNVGCAEAACRRGNSTIQHSAARHHSDARTAVRKLRT